MKKIVRLTESDLIKLVKRVVNEQYKQSETPHIPSIKIGNMTIKEGDKILITDKEIDVNQLNQNNKYIVNSYYGTIYLLEEEDGKLTIKINGKYSMSPYLKKAINDKTEPMGDTDLGIYGEKRDCLKITMDIPNYINTIRLKQTVPVLVFPRLNIGYLSSDESNCKN